MIFVEIQDLWGELKWSHLKYLLLISEILSKQRDYLYIWVLRCLELWYEFQHQQHLNTTENQVK